jgi:RNA polymerase sigma-70 factor (ECF subfamily)
MEGYKHKDISKELGISEGTSHWHLQNARKILQTKLSKF